MKIKESTNFLYKPWVWIVSALLLIIYPLTIGIPVLIILIALVVYAKVYFKGEKFNQIKNDISKYIEDCNELNNHIETLKSSYLKTKKTDFGEAQFTNTSKYKYQKKYSDAKYAPNIYDCSSQVCGNAQKQPFKYLCKYFNINTDEETLSEYEEILNNFSAAEEGKVLLKNKKDSIIQNLENKIPYIIRKLFVKELEANLGFEEIAFNTLYFPQFTFRYISSGGNSSSEFTITMDIPMLERFVNYLNENIKKRKSAAGQRALMTPKLREYIKERDNYTCKCCGNSISREPNLLLEIDHIVPVSKGGLTEESNLQTLCWKCNRTKGAKIL